jgi:hypothetical protein
MYLSFHFKIDPFELSPQLRLNLRGIGKSKLYIKLSADFTDFTSCGHWKGKSVNFVKVT